MQKKLPEQTALPVGFPMPDWQPRPAPSGVVLHGSLCRLEPVHPERHTDALCTAYQQAGDASDWTYMMVGPFPDKEVFRDYVQQLAQSRDPLHFVVIEVASNAALGTLALMRHNPQHGVIEVGHVAFSPALQGTRMATEAQFLLMRYVFDQLGYRRYEWKCDSLNRRSIKAAQRLGFSYEGTFRQAMVYKGRNRDTAWFALIDQDWPRVKRAISQWLSPDNFDVDGYQRRRLQEIRERGAHLRAT